MRDTNGTATKMIRIPSAFVAVAFALAVVAQSAAADPVADFYRGKSVRLIVGGAAGGGYDAVGRLLSTHLGRHIPGNPAVHVENMSGAGSLILMNYIHNKSPADGTVMAMPTTNVLLDAKLQPPGAGRNAAFDINRVSWIGTPARQPQVLFVWHDTPFRTLADLRSHKMVIGAISVATDTYILPMFMRQLLGAEATIIPGYKGSPDILTAMERREVDALVALLANVTGGNASYLVEGKIRPVLQFGRGRSAELPMVPTAAEWAETQADKQLFEAYGIKYEMSYPIMVVPGVPAERVASLRAAFDQTMTDPAYQADAQRMGIALNPLSGAEMHDLMTTINDMPDDLVTRLRALISAPSAQ
jgi:tripartite-type tricarboxylate transporter receptor subunit TctC